jgi:hypothetical protein
MHRFSIRVCWWLMYSGNLYERVSAILIGYIVVDAIFYTFPLMVTIVVVMRAKY